MISLRDDIHLRCMIYFARQNMIFRAGTETRPYVNGDIVDFAGEGDVPAYSLFPLYSPGVMPSAFLNAVAK